MSSRFWTDKTDGVDDIVAEDFNSAFDIIAADVDKKAEKQTVNGGFEGGNGASAGGGSALGTNAKAIHGGAVGYNANTTFGGSVGLGAYSEYGGSVGASAKTSDGFAGGKSAQAVDSDGNGIDAIQLGTGTNSEEKTAQFYDYKIMKSDGNIPVERLTELKKLSVPHTTASGYPVSVSDHLEGESVIDYRVYGNSVQETRSGKNLFSGFTKGIGIDSSTGADMTNATYASSDYIPVNFNTNANYYFSGLGTEFIKFIAAYNANKEFLGRTGESAIATLKLQSSSFVSGTAQGTGDIAYVRVTTRSTTGTIDDIDNLKVQLEVGSTATAYEQYGAMPSPNFPSEIKSTGDLVTDTSSPYYGKYDVPVTVCGKNLIDVKKTTINNGTIQEITGLNSGDYCFSFKTYNNTSTVGSRIYVKDTSGNGSYLSTTVLSSANSGGGIAACNFSYDKDTYPQIFIACYASETNVSADSFMLVSGTYSSSNIPSYEPYIGETKHIYLDEPLRKVGDYADYVDYENNQIVRKVGTSTVNFSLYKYESDTKSLYLRAIINNMLPIPTSCMSNKIQSFAKFPGGTNDNRLLIDSNGKVYYFVAAEESEQQDYVDKMQNVTIYYPLATPTTEPITVPELTAPNSAVMNISSETATQPSQIGLTYYQDINKVITNLTNAVLAQGGNV